MIIDDYGLLIVSVVCINGGQSALFFWNVYKINVINVTTMNQGYKQGEKITKLNFSKKYKGIKKTKKKQKKVRWNPHLYILLEILGLVKAFTLPNEPQTPF